ncbi:SET domain-containing protein [Daedalea quercina L-15889]|uniref:SET domain-containing protein n=1 Tax=Daedalea quercina L-15889 TaxID=1314783 RepID=A0A165QWV3_9APHY|nr:SET domain-containing protein [Daedalea quercina L-15889]
MMSRTFSAHRPLSVQRPASFRLSIDSNTTALLSRRSHPPPSSPGAELETLKVPTYYVSGVQDKGKGVVATQPLPRGAIFLEEQPLFTQDPGCTNSNILSALVNCTRDEQREYFKLANAYKNGGKVLPALAIFRTNSFACDDNQQTAVAMQRRGIFLIAARINHSCTPNVGRVWEPARQMMVFRTLRAVLVGEELCINYVDVLGTKEDRNANLVERFGFECACEACAMQGEELAQSDQRRAAIRRLYDEVSACLKEPTLGMRKAQLALRLLQEEGLALYESTFCFDAFQLCVLVSDFANAKAWVRKAWEASCVSSGPDGLAARTFKMYWANPRAHRLSGTMPRMVLSGPV